MASEGRGWLVGCSIFLVLLVTGGAILVLSALLVSEDELNLPQRGPKVGVVEIFGVLGENDDVLAQLDRLENESSVEALVLHIDTGGGAVGTVQRIIARLDDFASEGMPIVAALDNVAASGGYYIATAADSIFALPGTLTGSIGVIASFPDFSGLMKRVGVDVQVVKTGQQKDAGAPYRALSDEERKWMQTVLDDVGEQFMDAIASSRGLSIDAVREVADGRIFSGRMAMESGLVDRLAGLEEAVEVAAAMANIEGEPVVIRKHVRRPLWERLIGGRLGGGSLLRQRPQLEYRWR
jgi:protease-4